MMRAAVFCYGDTFVLIRCMASSKTYLEMADYFGVTIHRFEFQNILLPVLIGQWEKHCIDTYCFNGPESGFAPVASNREAIVEQSLSLYLEGICTGLLNIKVVRRPLAAETPAQTRINNILYDMVEKSGMSFGKDLVALKGEHKNLGGTAYYARNQDLEQTRQPLISLPFHGKEKAPLFFCTCSRMSERNPP
jgi:hypothetical protein